MHNTRISVLAITLSASVSIAGCSGSSNDSQSAAAIAVAGAPSSEASGGSGGASTALGSAGSIAQAGGVSLNLPDDMGPGMAGSTGVAGAPSEPYPDTLPDGFTAANMLGGYRVGDEISPNAEAPTDNPDAKLEGCGTTILAVVRDFQADGKNFESLQWGDDRNLVSPTLGPDRKPVFAPSGPTYTVQDPAQFNNWYRTVDGLNRAYKLELWFAPNNGVSSFQSTSFYPLDGKGFGEGSTDHNFYFTTEIHTRFKYQGGESFRFTGDDDVWVFINDKLAIDLGGVHPAEDASIDIDARAAELGLEKGKVYAFDMFQNERHTYESNFRADTNLNFVDCGTIVPELPIPK